MNEEEAKKTLKTMKENIDKKYLKSRNSVAIEIVLNLIQTQQAEIDLLKDFKEIAESKVTDLNPIGLARTNQLLSRQCHKLQEEIEKKDKMIDKIQKEVRDHIGFENRLKRDNKEPDLFNQGRFYVANNINNILKGKVENGN